MKKRDTFDAKIKSKFGNSLSPSSAYTSELPLDDLDFDDEVIGPLVVSNEDPVDASVKAVNLYLIQIHAEVLLPQGENLIVPRSKVALKKFKGDLIGSDDSNPLLNSIVCDVEFLDVAVKLYVAYVIAKNMYSPVYSIDTITCSWIIILDYLWSTAAVGKDDMYIYTKSWQWKQCQTTVG